MDPLRYLWGPSVRHDRCNGDWQACILLTAGYRLRCTRSPTREVLPRERAGCLGTRHPPVHDRLQGEPLLQHRRDHGPGAAHPLDHERAEHRSHQVDAGTGRGSAVEHHAGDGAPMVPVGGFSLADTKTDNVRILLISPVELFSSLRPKAPDG